MVYRVPPQLRASVSPAWLLVPIACLAVAACAFWLAGMLADPEATPPSSTEIEASVTMPAA